MYRCLVLRCIVLRIIFILVNCHILCQAKSYKNYQLWRVYAQNERQARFLANLTSIHPNLDLWKTAVYERHQPAEFVVPPRIAQSIEKELTSADLTFEIILKNLQKNIDAEASTANQLFRAGADEFALDKYNTYDQINKYLTSIADSVKEVKVFDIGKSIEQRAIKIVKISRSTKPKPSIWIDAGIHAREWITSATALYMINQLSKNTTDTIIQKALDRYDWYIVPLLNPDGYEYSRVTDRYWRKNRRPLDWGCNGIDLNRNWDIEFGGASTSTNQCSYMYHGNQPFSEPETKAVKDYLTKNRDEFIAYFTLHAYGQVIMYPWGYDTQICPPDIEDLAKVAERGVAAIKSVYGTQYRSGTPANLLYSVGGASDDWAKKLGIKYTYCLELRPCENCYDGFTLPASQILPTGQETLAGLLAMADEIFLRSPEKSELLKKANDFDRNANCKIISDYYVAAKNLELSSENSTTGTTTTATPKQLLEITTPLTTTTTTKTTTTSTTTTTRTATSSTTSSTIASTSTTTTTSTTTRTTTSVSTTSTTRTTTQTTPAKAKPCIDDYMDYYCIWLKYFGYCSNLAADPCRKTCGQCK